jgi:hypothetical protein
MKLILLIIATFFLNFAYGQTKQNCYDAYLKLFKERKTLPLLDGEHDVVVTVRDLKDGFCYSRIGKISILKDQISSALLLKDSKGQYVNPKKVLHDNYNNGESNLKLNLKVVDGMSGSFLTKDKHIVNIFFIDVLKPKAPALIEAPDVSTYK